jgi:hypothetical protein
MPARRHRASPATGREGPPQATAVLHYDQLLAQLPKETVAAALLAALSFPVPEQHHGWDGTWMTCQCRDKGGQRRTWPCPEAQAVIDTLSGERS